MNDLEKTITELKKELNDITLVAVSKTKSNEDKTKTGKPNTPDLDGDPSIAKAPAWRQTPAPPSTPSPICC